MNSLDNTLDFQFLSIWLAALAAIAALAVAAWIGVEMWRELRQLEQPAPTSQPPNSPPHSKATQ